MADLFRLWYEFKALTEEIESAEGLRTTGAARRALDEFDTLADKAASWDAWSDQRRRMVEIDRILHKPPARRTRKKAL